MDEQDLKEIVEDISFLVSVKDSAKLRNILYSTHPADMADILRSLPQDGRGYIFSLLDPRTASDVVVELDESSREELLEEIDEKRLAEIVDEMDSDDATDLIAELPPALAEKILRSIEPKDRQEVQELLRHEEDTAGGIMALEFIAVDKDSTVDEAIREIRRRTEEVGEIYDVYVVDKAGRLVGILPLQRLILYNPSTRIAEIMEQDVISVEADTDQEQVANLVRHYNLVSVPVVDKQGKLVGRITVDDVMDVMEEEATEDIQRMAGSAEEALHETSIFRISRFRLPWLLVAFVGELASAFILSRFQASLEEILAVAFFIPIIMAMGGNSGIQSSTIVVRGLATGELGLMNARRRLRRELAVSLFNGFICGSLIFAVSSLWLDNPKFGLVVGAAMLLVICNAALVGACVPLVLRRMGFDPAIATGPFITTSNDVLGLLVYLGLTTISLKWL